MNATDYLVHFSNILLLVSYSVRDILWLRWFAVAAAITNTPYFLLQETVLWPPVMWAAVFTAINLYQIARIYLERRPVVLAPDEQKLYDLAFRSLRPREFLSLALAGDWKDAVAGERLLTEGEAASQVCIPVAGTVDVRRRGQPRGNARAGPARWHGPRSDGHSLAHRGVFHGRCALHGLAGSQLAPTSGQETGAPYRPATTRKPRRVPQARATTSDAVLTASY